MISENKEKEELEKQVLIRVPLVRINPRDSIPIFRLFIDIPK